MESKKKKFKTKSFATFTISWIFLILSFSGVVIYFTPAGRIANWTNWTFSGLTKDEWQGFHVIFACLFLLFIFLHLFFNWKVLMSYFKNKSTAGIHLKREFALATVIAGLFIVVCLVKWQPVWALIELKENFKQRDNIVTTVPPIPHTEDLTITGIAAINNIQVEKLIERIHAKNYVIENSNITLAVLAEQNNTTPEKLYSEIVNEEYHNALEGRGSGSGFQGKYNKERVEILEKETDSVSRSNLGSPGYGRKTVKELCEEVGISVKQGLENLKDNGVSARAGDRIRNLAADHNIRPSEIVRYLDKR